MLAQHVQPQLTLALPGNDLEIQLLGGKVKWYLANYGSFYFDCLGGNGFMGINTKKNYPKNGLIYPRPVFIARRYDQTLRP